MDWQAIADAFNSVDDRWKWAAVSAIHIWAIAFGIRWWPRKGAVREP